MADRTPYYYKDPAQVAALFEGPYFLSAIRKVLLKLPTAPNFKESQMKGCRPGRRLDRADLLRSPPTP